MYALWDFPLSDNPPHLRPTIDFRVNTPKLTQVVTGRNFHYFKLRLFDINRFFPTKKSWNKDYPPGQKIYSDTTAAIALRNIIATEHSILYSSRPGRDGNVEGMLERKPKAFFDLLKQYADSSSPFQAVHSTISDFLSSSKENQPKASDSVDMYTYVLMDDTLRFSRSGAGTSVDFSSKHALHAGAFPEVCYAGEFWIDPYDNEWGQVLIMDNNSGTFAPPKCDLHRMKFLMEANFPGIPLIVLDYQDPEWKKRRKIEE